ncbi:glyoxalase [Halobacterium sp. DL1]|jgi:catechol 2,3-dioxygenase-like lactoylglutathione lyase family enzyme|nr:glyoxalase [Halobacterium sp. DL1]
MVRASLNHVSVLARDLEASAEFYCDVLGLERVPAPKFEVPVQWLQAESGQIHLFERDMEPVPYYHFGVTVDDFEGVYQRAKSDGLFANWGESSNASVYELPDGGAQMYVNDPEGNLVEVDYPDFDAVDKSIVEEVVNRDDLIPQTGAAANATLNLSPVGRENE